MGNPQLIPCSKAINIHTMTKYQVFLRTIILTLMFSMDIDNDFQSVFLYLFSCDNQWNIFTKG